MFRRSLIDFFAADACFRFAFHDAFRCLRYATLLILMILMLFRFSLMLIAIMSLAIRLLPRTDTPLRHFRRH